MESKARIGRHPIHPMLIAFPIAFYTTCVLSFITFYYNSDPFWFRLGYLANVAGVVTAIVAMIPGFIDWAYAIPNYNPAKRTGVVHMALNLGALLFFAINWWVQSGQWNEPAPVARAAVTLSVLGLLCTLAAGFYGWRLVQRHHVGIDLTLEQLRLEPTEPDRVFGADKTSSRSARAG